MTDRSMMGFDVGANGAAIVVVVQHDGSYLKLVDDRMCKGLAADLLHGIADQVGAEHEPGVCSPPPQHDRPRDDERANPRGGRIDRDRGVYVDPRGNAFDLSLTWGDWFDRTWKWQGSTGQFGEPVLQADDGEVQPFGVLRALYGPISPRSGGAA
ncbi:phiSA1p31-related protein [Streptomyces anthocyanicus]|uniref:phiSA1p31-related protein n=1 Tax=Streptomyces anthocyanicus TaxID=68174 RepID=UPI00366720FB